MSHNRRKDVTASWRAGSQNPAPVRPLQFPLSIAAAVAFGAVFFIAANARAFCRTVTELPPADYDPQIDGCFTGSASAKVLYWKNACVGFSVQKEASRRVPFDQATTAIDSAFERWSDTLCGTGDHPSILPVDLGPVDCGLVEYNRDRANQHVIVFRDDMWPYNDPRNTLGLTTLTFDTMTGEIFDADMEINSKDNEIVAGGSVMLGSFDLGTIITHEAGHFLGLAHSPDTNAVMFARYQSGSMGLTSDDVDAICAVYAPDGTRSTSAAPVQQDACDSTPRHGFSALCGADQPPPAPPAAGTKGGCSMSRSASIPRGFVAAVACFALGWFARRRAKASRHRCIATIAVALGLCATFFAGGAGADVSTAVLFDELVGDADAVVVATPVEAHGAWESGRIYTYTRVRLETVIAGHVSDTIWIRTMGGVVGTIGQIVEGEPSLTVGRPTLLFLSAHRNETFQVTARAQGQFSILPDGRGSQRLKSARALSQLVPTPAARVARVTVPWSAHDVLDGRLLEEALGEIATSWSRLHAK
jgi:hypothetical protein